jgi:hypothetical protein
VGDLQHSKLFQISLNSLKFRIYENIFDDSLPFDSERPWRRISQKRTKSDIYVFIYIRPKNSNDRINPVGLRQGYITRLKIGTVLSH